MVEGRREPTPRKPNMTAEGDSGRGRGATLADSNTAEGSEREVEHRMACNLQLLSLTPLPLSVAVGSFCVIGALRRSVPLSLLAALLPARSVPEMPLTPP